MREPSRDAETTIIPPVGRRQRPGGQRPGGRPPGLADAETTLLPPVAYHDADTSLLPPVAGYRDTDTGLFPPMSGDLGGDPMSPATTTSTGPSLGKASGSMAIAGLFSKITGFARTLVIAWVLGLSVAADAYNAANTMPNQVYELLVGGVLTSVMVPVLVRAHTDDKDGGVAYTQRLVTMVTSVLAVVTLLAVAAAPLLTALLISKSSVHSNPALTTAFAYLLLPQILFYGLSALFTAILNARHVFGVTVWAPVANNIVLLITFGAYPFLPGRLTLNPVHMDDLHVLELGIGSTLGVLVQALLLLPPLFRHGFKFRWRWGWDPRFGEFGRLAMWTVSYALLAQVGVFSVTKVATNSGGLTIYNSVWLLVQLPYGVVGFALITAILPRMSRAAAQGRIEDLKDDMSLATRLCTALMLPMSALMTVLGPSLGVALFSVGKGSGDAAHLGAAMAVAAFGVLPYSVVMIQIRAFYAMKDARTPVLIMVVMMAVKVGLSFLAPHLLSANDTVFGLVFANSMAFVVGWIVGEVWLHVRIGRLGTRRIVVTVLKSLLAALVGAAVAEGVHLVAPGGVSGAWVSLVGGGVLGMILAVAVLLVLRTRELQPVLRRLGRLAHR